MLAEAAADCTSRFTELQSTVLISTRRASFSSSTARTIFSIVCSCSLQMCRNRMVTWPSCSLGWLGEPCICAGSVQPTTENKIAAQIAPIQKHFRLFIPKTPFAS